jgi:hypothetical protein
MDKDKNFERSKANLVTGFLDQDISTLSNLEIFRVNESDITGLKTDAKWIQENLTYNSVGYPRAFYKSAVDLIEQGENCYEQPWKATELLDNYNSYHYENLLSSDFTIAKDLAGSVRDINNNLQINLNSNLRSDCVNSASILKANNMEKADGIENNLAFNIKIDTEVLNLGKTEPKDWSGNKLKYLPFPKPNLERFGLNKMNDPIKRKLFSKDLRDRFLESQTYESKLDWYIGQDVYSVGLNDKSLCKASVELTEQEKAYRKFWELEGHLNPHNLYQDMQVANDCDNIIFNLRAVGRWRTEKAASSWESNSRINNKVLSSNEIRTGLLSKVEERLNMGLADTVLPTSFFESEKFGNIKGGNKFTGSDIVFPQSGKGVNVLECNREIDSRLSDLIGVENSFLTAGKVDSFSLLEPNYGRFALNKIKDATNITQFSKVLKVNIFESQKSGREFPLKFEQNVNLLKLDSTKATNFENNLNSAVYDYDNKFIVEISKISLELVDIYKGAVEANYTKLTDYKRSVAHSLRELISITIRILGPKDEVVKWAIKTNRKNLLFEGRPKRKARLWYAFRNRPKRERQLIGKEAASIVEFYNFFNKPSHNPTCNISEKLLDNYFDKVKNTLKTIVLLYNYPTKN